MKKVKSYLTYMIAIICICFTLIYQPNEASVLKFIETNQDKVIIYMLDKDKEIIPISINYKKSDNDIENITYILKQMKIDFGYSEFNQLIYDSIHCLGVDIKENIVKLNFNEAFYTMNSKYELRVIEGIVSSVLQFNKNYKVEFLVNGDKIEKMPLSNVVMKSFDSTLGVNNFELESSNLHLSKPIQVVSLKNAGETSYYVVKTKRLSSNILIDLINQFLHENSYLLNCEKIEKFDDRMTLHLNDKFLMDENTIDNKKIMWILYTLKINGYANEFVLKVNDEIKTISGIKTQSIKFDYLNLNVFEL